MKSVLFSVFFLICFHAFAQNTWTNLPEEYQAERALSQENYPRAIQLYEQALEIRKAKYAQGYRCGINAFKELVDALDHLIIAHGKAGNHARKIELCEKLSSWTKEGMELYPQKPSPYLEYGLIQIKIAESYQALEQYDKGLNVCQNLVDYFMNADNRPFKFVAKQIIPFTHSRAGEILKDKGNTEASVIQHEKSVAAWQNALKQIKASLVHEEIALQSKICVQRFEKLKDSSNVIKYAEIALEHYEILMNMHAGNTKFTKGVNNVGNTLAIYKSAQAKYEEAIEHYKRSLHINEKQFKQSGNTNDLTQMAAVNLKISECYESLQNISQSAQHLSTRIDHLKKLQELLPTDDYSYTISRNQYNLAKQYESLKQYSQALEVLDASIALTPTVIEKDPKNTQKKEWQWIQEFFRYQLLREMENYKLAHMSLERLKNIFIQLEKLDPEIRYSEHIKEIETSQRELAYPDVVKLDGEIEKMEDGKLKFDQSVALVKLLKKKMKKDASMQLSYVKHTSALAWTGLMVGEYKRSRKALKKAMKIKPVDPYLITNYAPCLLFLGKYKKADKVYASHYDEPFKPGKKIIHGFIDDFEKFEEKGVIPEIHRAKVEEIKGKLELWMEEMDS